MPISLLATPFKDLPGHLQKLLIKHRLQKKYAKAIEHLSIDIQLPGLKFEALAGRADRYSFRIDVKWRAFCSKEGNFLDVFTINNHQY